MWCDVWVALKALMGVDGCTVMVGSVDVESRESVEYRTGVARLLPLDSPCLFPKAIVLWTIVQLGTCVRCARTSINPFIPKVHVRTRQFDTSPLRLQFRPPSDA